MSEQIVTSIGQLLDFAERTSYEFAHVVWFRGHADADPNWTLRPSVFRHFQSVDEEVALTLNFCRHAPSRHASTPSQGDRAAWLCLAQHYGLPTRLLDWTESILCAAFFAVSDMSNADAAIYALQPLWLNATVGMNYVPTLSDPELRGRIAPAFGRPDAESDVVAALLPDVDLRMFLQQGVFTLHSSRAPLEQVTDSRRFLTRAIIPAAAKAKLGWNLRICGVSRSKLFPDLANLASDIVRKRKRS